MIEDAKVSFVICTRNRCAEVCQAIESCLAQTCRPAEIIVLDDASTDDTALRVPELFPEVRLITSQSQEGSAALRNKGFREARGAIVATIDDDAYFTDSATLGGVMAVFAADERTAVVAMPYLEANRSPACLMKTSRIGTPLNLRSFVSCAYAVRREVALSVGGYRDFFFYRGEERDLSIRLLEAGYRIVLAPVPPVMHLYHPVRAVDQMFTLGIRNNLLFDMLNIPQPYVLPRMLLDSLQLLFYRASAGQIPTRIRDILAGFRACIQYLSLRKPVRRQTYRLYRSMPRHGAWPVTGSLPPPLRRQNSDKRP